MTEKDAPPGAIAWIDLTVPDADRVRDFYAAVTGWTPVPVDMGGYADYAMAPPGADQPVAGVCFKRGPNADLPSQWLIYVLVADLDASIARVAGLGGRVVAGPRDMGGQGRYCVIEDPAGAVAAIWEKR
jgi:predicted enzyme related to lactoylglutathione lyase